MDLLRAINHGIAQSGAQVILDRPNAKQRATSRHHEQIAAAVAATRKQWLNALQVDETAAWMSIYEQRPDVLRGVCAILTLAALAREHDDGNLDAPQVRVIRGAVSAVEQSGKAGSVITPELTQALSTAARMATEIVNTCSQGAIEHACAYLSSFAKQLGS